MTSICFTNDKLEAVFEQLNIVGANGTQPKETVTYSLYTLNPEMSATNNTNKMRYSVLNDRSRYEFFSTSASTV